MSADKPSNKTPQNVSAQVEAEAQDEIEEIMKEINSLQQGGSVVPAATAPVKAASTVVEASAPETVEEFHGNGDDASLEETLGGMKEEPSGPSLLDVPTTEEASAVEEAPPVEEEIVEEVVAEAETPVSETSSVETEEVTDAVTDALEKIESQAHAEPIPLRPRMVAQKKMESPMPQKIRQAEAQPEDTIERSYAGAPNDGSLMLTLAGTMTLKLKYEYEGQEVTIGFCDQTLKVQLSDGTEFKIPIGRGSKAVA